MRAEIAGEKQDVGGLAIELVRQALPTIKKRGNPEINSQMRNFIYPGELANRDTSHLVDPLTLQRSRTGNYWEHPVTGARVPDYRDKRNYQVLDFGAIEKLAHQINAYVEAEVLAGRSPDFAIAFWTGGTIAMQRSSDGVLQVAVTGQSLLEAVGYGLKDRIKIFCLDVAQLDSADMHNGVVSETLAALIYIERQLYPNALNCFIGTIVGHGTDTAEYSIAKLHMLNPNPASRLIMTAAQRDASSGDSGNPSWALPDGPINIAASLSVLLKLKEHNRHGFFLNGGGGVAATFYQAGQAAKISDKLVTIFGNSGTQVPAIDLSGGDMDLDRLPSHAPGHGFPLWLQGENPVRYCQIIQGPNVDQLIRDVLFDTTSRFLVIRSFGASTAPEVLLRGLHLIQLIADEKARRGLPHLKIIAGPLKADALMHDYASNAGFRQLGIPIVIAHPGSLQAKLELAAALYPNNSQMALDFALSPFFDEFPDQVANFYRNNAPMTPTQFCNYLNEFQFKVADAGDS